jgi:pimeloyl-ACP methyl ester carboxylesterase
MMMNRAIGVILILAWISALQALPARATETAVHQGELNGVPYRIQIPPDWNHNLVMYAHAYQFPGGSWKPLPDVIGAVFLERGFAVAESGYSSQGWAIKEAVSETEALRLHFAERYGVPDTTFVTGHSMGGLITLATIEIHPDAYEGALPMCGPLAPSLLFFKDHVFDMLVTFEALFGTNLPQEYRPVVEAAALPAPVAEQALAADSLSSERFAAHWGIRRGELAGILSLYHALYRELADRAGGNPIDNRNSVYCGFEPIRGLNADVPRYGAEPQALQYLRRYYTPSGEIEDPVIAIHTTYDAGVPPSLPDFYNTLTELQGTGEWFVQMYVEADGHCNIAPAYIGRAFDMLRAWAAGGARPEPGILQ